MYILKLFQNKDCLSKNKEALNKRKLLKSDKEILLIVSVTEKKEE